jgi:hypothetical protein
MLLYAELEPRQRQSSAWDLPPLPNLPSHAHVASAPQLVPGVPQSPSHDVAEDDGTTNLAPPQFDDGTICIEGTDSDGAEKNPYTTHYDPLVDLSPCWLCRPTEASEQNVELNELGFVYYDAWR